MKHFKLSLLLFLAAIFIPVLSFAQAEDVIPTAPDASQFLNWYNVIYASLVIIWGGIAKAFGLKWDRWPLVFTVIAGGLVISAGFIWFGWVQFLPVAVTLLGSLGLYDILKGLRKSAEGTGKK